MDRAAPKKAQQVRPTPRGIRGSSFRRRVNFCQRFSSKKSLDEKVSLGEGAIRAGQLTSRHRKRKEEARRT